MNIIKYFKNNVIFIVPDYYKENIIKLINKQNNLFNIKVYSISEIKKKLFFTYDEKTILYLINNYNMSYSYALDILNNLYYISFDENNLKLKFFKAIKDDLIYHNLLIYDIFFLDSFKNKKCYVYGFNYLYKFDKKILKMINTKTKLNYIEKEKSNFNHQVIAFKNINQELEYIANDIINKINQGVNINNIYLANISSEYLSTIKRIFAFYHLPLNLNEKTPLYNITSSFNLLNNLDQAEVYIDKIANSEIKNKCIDVLNKYYFINNLSSIKNIITEELKNNYLISPSYKDAVNIIDLKNTLITDEMVIYLIGFAQEYIPTIYRDENLISDNIKPEYIEQTWELNNIEFQIWDNIIKTTKNLTITFSNNYLTDSFALSPLASELKIINAQYKESSYSNQSNIFNLGIMLDNYYKYGDYNDLLYLLNYNYPHAKYLTYRNEYDLINPSIIKNYLNNNIYLSYSKLDIYYKCSFRFYLEHILKLNIYEDKFETYMGSLSHYLLSKIYNEDFDFDKEKSTFLKENPFNLSPANKIFLAKMSEDLKPAINHILNHHNHTLFKEIECEKNIEVIEKINNINIKFYGIIDKIMKYENKVAIIDYKTYEVNTDLSLIDKGLNIQLPIYTYLVKKAYPDINIIGIYLQNINRLMPNYDIKKSFEKIKQDNLRLQGYTIDDENIIKDFDFTYQNSDYIKAMKLTQKGFYAYTKLLNENHFKMVYQIAEELILDCANNIMKAKFDINPKIVNKNNESCKYCDYKALCFVKDKNFNYVKKDKDLLFLGGNYDEMD